jgi:hypothetical protein
VKYRSSRLSLAHNPNGVRTPTFPTGGAFLLSVIQFQDGGRRSAVVSVEVRIWSTTPKCIDKWSKNWLDWKVHITPKTQACDLCSLLFNIIVLVECPRCPDWKWSIIKIMMTDQFECTFVTGFRDNTRRIFHIYAIHYNWKEDFEVI